MHITEITIGKVRIPLIKPYTPSLRTVDSIEDIVIIIKTDNGLLGYGSATPTQVITGDSQGSIIYALSNIICPKILGKNVLRFNELLFFINNSLERNYSAKAAVEIALYDLLAKKYNMPLYQLLGGGTPEITTGMSLVLKDLTELITDTKYFIKQGFTNLKIKCGAVGGIDEDLERVVAIRKTVGKNISICIDANQSWSIKQSLKIIKEFEIRGLNISMVEQPIKSYDIDGLKFLRDHLETDIYADESCFIPRDAVNMINKNAVDGISIKLMKAGGIYNVINMFDIATYYGIGCVASCMLESPISLTAMASIIVGRRVKYVDLDPLNMITHNPIVGGARLEGAKVILSNEPGLGIISLGEIEIVSELK